MNIRYCSLLLCMGFCGGTALGDANIAGDAARDHIRVERETFGGTRVTLVEGTESTVDPPREQPARQATASPAPQTGRATLMVVPAIFSRHFEPVFRFSESIDVSGRTNLRLQFTTEQESRMEGPAFTVALTDAFVSSRKFDVLERARLTEVLREIDFGESDYADVNRIVPLGLALNAQYVVLPEIEAIELIESEEVVPYVGQTRRRLQGKMIVRMRVTDTATTRITASALEEVRVERRPRPNEPFTETELNNLILDLYQAASLRLLHRALEVVYPVRIVQVDEEGVVLNRGTGSISEGDEFDVYALGGELIDPDTGESLGFRERLVARIKVERVAPRFSEASIIEGADRLTGDPSRFLCRESEASIAAKNRVSPRPMNW